VGASASAKVRQFALDGEREIACIPKATFPDPKPANDVSVNGRIYFHVRGRQPNAVTLYLRAEEVSPLHYTELGWHTHSGTLHGDVKSTTLTAQDTAHQHGKGTLITQIEKEETFFDGANTFNQHQHWLRGRIGGVGAVSVGAFKGICVINTDANITVVGNEFPAGDDFLLEVMWGRHRHDIEGDTDTAGFQHAHTHSLEGITAEVQHAGAEDTTGGNLAARSGQPLSYPYAIQVMIDGEDRTEAVKDQIKAVRPSSETQAWDTLGDGTGNHPIVLQGTGPIRLDFLGQIHFTEGEHSIELRLQPSLDGGPNGGRILYNLYVE
jgi:hypothetical protein